MPHSIDSVDQMLKQFFFLATPLHVNLPLTIATDLPTKAEAGVSRPNVWYLMIENRYYGRLMHTDRGWVFHSEWMPEIGEMLAESVIAWYE